MHSVVGLEFEDGDGVWKVHSVSEDDDLEYAVKVAFYWNVDEATRHRPTCRPSSTLQRQAKKTTDIAAAVRREHSCRALLVTSPRRQRSRRREGPTLCE
jgi:hypothetical protein